MACVVAVVGATGLVGREMLRTLERRGFPAKRVVPLASSRSAGSSISYRGETLRVEQANADRFAGIDIALFSAGATASRELAPLAAARGAVVIDNSSAWRMDPQVPLVVPEVNPDAVNQRPKGIIANPNCSTIQMVAVLKPIHDRARLKHVVVSTYQAASGKGQAAVEELRAQTRELAAGQTPRFEVFPGPLAGNLVMDWKPGEDGYSDEELKMVYETRKILGDESIAVSPTCVRVPIVTGHSEAIHIQCHRPIDAAEVKSALSTAPGVIVEDDGYAPGKHPQPMACADQDAVYVGRIRNDVCIAGAVNLWVVADNLRKGAALNAVQIAELLV
jgi:aspartate-semialdehyde dehydrogenase